MADFFRKMMGSGSRKPENADPVPAAKDPGNGSSAPVLPGLPKAPVAGIDSSPVPFVPAAAYTPPVVEKKAPVPPPPAPVVPDYTVIGHDVELKGTLSFQKKAVINGRLEGRITDSKGTLVIGSTGNVKANLEVDNCTVEGGLITGNVLVRNKLEMMSRSKIVGDIKADRLVIQDNVIMQGNCQVGLDRVGK